MTYKSYIRFGWGPEPHANFNRSISDINYSQRPARMDTEKRAAPVRDTTRGDEDEDGSSELSEPEDADGPR